MVWSRNWSGIYLTNNGESADTLKYLDIYYFISNIVRLYYMPKNSNSEENEFGKDYTLMAP